jgi:hypothetical protein
MSDRTYFQLVVFAAPEAELAAFRAALDADPEEPDPGRTYADSTLADLGDPADEPLAVLGEAFPIRWGWEEERLDAASEYGPLIAATMPGATFSAWADPAYEYPGECYDYAPDLGAFVGVCDADGVPYVSARDILKAPNMTAIRDLVGAAWQERFAALNPAIAVILAADGR